MALPLLTGCIRLLSMLALWLTGCSTHAPPPQVDWAEHQQQLQQLTRYRARGSLTYRTTKRAAYAHFHWQQDANDHFRLRLLNPLGRSLLTVVYQADRLVVREQRGQERVGHEAKKLLQSLTGLSISPKLLVRWLVGLPNPGDHFQLDQHQRLWQLTPAMAQPPLQLYYLSYHPPSYRLRTHTVPPYHGTYTPPLPERLRLQFGTATITLKIDHWILH